MGSHWTPFGWPLTESSKIGAKKVSSLGGVPPVASATAFWMASRTLSLPVATVIISKSAFCAL